MCTWLAGDASGGVRALAAIVGVAVGLLVVLLSAWAAAGDEAPGGAVTVALDRAPVRPMGVPEPAPMGVPVRPMGVPVPVPVAVPALSAQLEAGRALAAAGAPPGEVDPWIEETRAALAQHRPGVLGYFASLGSRTFPDDEARLAAHLRRLETIVAEMT